MDNGQCENLADDTMASYHEVPYLFIEDSLHHCPLSILPSCVPHCPLSIVHCPLPTAPSCPSGWGLIGLICSILSPLNYPSAPNQQHSSGSV